MPRRPIDALPQSQLVLELKIELDTIRHTKPGTSAYHEAVDRLCDLIRANPTASTRAHVLHNLGQTRRRFARHLAATVPDHQRALVGRLAE